MKTLANFRTILLLTIYALTAPVGVLQAQEAAPSAAQAQSQPQPQSEPGTAQAATEHSEGTAESAGGGPNAGVGLILEHATETAAHSAETWGGKLGLSHDISYLLSLVINFATIAILFYLLVRSKLPQMLRDRTTSIQKAIREAQAASAEANQRLSSIEARLAKLGTEIEGIRGESEKQALAEEERIRAAAEEDKRKVIDSAKSEIDAIARNARRELKNYAASLAVDTAAQRIHVDAHADQSLVREFVDQLGKDGH